MYFRPHLIYANGLFSPKGAGAGEMIARCPKSPLGIAAMEFSYLFQIGQRSSTPQQVGVSGGGGLLSRIYRVTFPRAHVAKKKKNFRHGVRYIG